MTHASVQGIVAVGIVTSERGVLIGRRRDDTPPWTFPGGTVEPGGTPAEAAIREVMEEARLRVVVEQEIGRRVHPSTGRSMIYLACRPTGGTEAVADGRELSEVRWASFQEAERLLPDMYEPVRAQLARGLAR